MGLYKGLHGGVESGLLGRTAKHLKIGRLKSVLPENLLIGQLPALAHGSRFVYNCSSACFSEINIVPRNYGSINKTPTKESHINPRVGPVVDKYEMPCSLSCQTTSNPPSAIMNVVHCVSTPAWLKVAVAGAGAWESTLCCSCSNASNDPVAQRKCKLTQPQIWKSRPRGKSIFKNRRQN